MRKRIRVFLAMSPNTCLQARQTSRAEDPPPRETSGARRSIGDPRPDNDAFLRSSLRISIRLYKGCSRGGHAGCISRGFHASSRASSHWSNVSRHLAKRAQLTSSQVVRRGEKKVKYLKRHEFQPETCSKRVYQKRDRVTEPFFAFPVAWDLTLCLRFANDFRWRLLRHDSRRIGLI